MLRFLVDAWPTRRRLAWAALLPVLVGSFVLIGRASVEAPRPAGWYVGVSVAGVLGAAVLASYVPLAGGGLDLGCTPCAMLSGLTVVGAGAAIHHYDGALVGPLFASAMLLFGLSQRMSRPATCEAPVRSPR
jgi:hypothetical protein